MLGVGHLLGPEVGLYAHDVVLLVLSQFLGDDGLEGVHLRAGDDVAVGGAGLFAVVLQLRVVDVCIDVGAHDDAMLLLGSSHTALCAAPRHDDGVLRQAAGQYLVPADDAASAGGQELLYLVVDVGLELVLGAASVLTAPAAFAADVRLVRQAQLLNLCLALGALLPSLLGALVAADMDVGRGEHVAELSEDGLEECQRLGIASAEHLPHHAPVGSHGIGAARAAQVGEDVQGTLHVARHVYLRHHVDVALGRIANDVAALLLRVEAAVGDVVVDAHTARTDDGLLPHAALLRQVGQRLHLEAPTLVLGQMPVELVAAMQRHRIEELFDELDGEEVPAAIEQDATIAEARLVGYLHVGQLHGLGPVLHHGQALAQGLRGAEQSDRLGGTQLDALLAHRDGVGLGCGLRSLRCLELGIQHQPHLRLLVVGRQPELDAGGLLHPLLQELCDATRLGIAAVVGDARGRSDAQHLRRVGLHLQGKGNDVIVGTLGHRRKGQGTNQKEESGSFHKVKILYFGSYKMKLNGKLCALRRKKSQQLAGR